jgi:hypothetical protein
MNNDRGGMPNFDYQSYLLPALIGVLIVAAIAYYFMKTRERANVVPAASVVTAPASTTPIIGA